MNIHDRRRRRELKMASAIVAYRFEERMELAEEFLRLVPPNKLLLAESLSKRAKLLVLREPVKRAPKFDKRNRRTAQEIQLSVHLGRLVAFWDLLCHPPVDLEAEILVEHAHAREQRSELRI